MKGDFEVLYRRIGLLFYAAALAQRSLTIADYDRLTDMIRRYWPVGDDRSNHHLASALHIQVLGAVRDAFGQSMSAKEAMQLFTVFYAIHHLAFDRALKERVLETYRAISDEFSSHAPDARDRLRQLQLLLLGQAPDGSAVRPA